jgi:hypothetical protein
MSSLAFVDQFVGGDNHSEVDEAIELMIDWSLQAFGQEQIVKAKEDFFILMGKVFSDDLHYHPRMSYFADFFLFQRLLEWPASQFHGLTPFQAFLRHGDKAEAEIVNFRHSIYEVLKVDPHRLVVADLLVKQKYQVLCREREKFHGIAKKSIFQGFVYMSEEKNFLSRGLVFHPEECGKAIKKYVKAAKSAYMDEISMLAHLAKTQLRHVRHPRMKVEAIYTQNSI